MSRKPVVLMILDGYGLNKEKRGNAVLEANTPVMDRLMKECPFVEGNASGLAVGLPDGQMGNSEVGHLNMGAGRIVYQELTKITKAIEDGDFFENAEFLKAVENCKKNGSALHLMGLVSDGGVHSHMTHIFGLLELAKRNGLEKVFLHAFLDGRDVSPTSGADFVAQTVAQCREIGVGKIATVMGRYYAMDRDKRWDRVQRAYDAMTRGEGVQNPDPVDAVQRSYDAGVTDEFVEPVVCTKDGKVKEGDSIIFINFRPDRAREITRCFVDPAFTDVERKKGYFPVTYVCTTEYDATMPNVLVAFPHRELTNIFGEYIARQGYTQLRIAETEKYAHVTFFFNGGRETPYKNEERILVPSPKVATYDLKPEMSAYEVKDKLVEAINTQKFDFIVVNYANGDMVGHTGNFEATVIGVESVDLQLARVKKAVDAVNGILIVTADHGNDPTYKGTDHTREQVPLLAYSRSMKGFGELPETDTFAAVGATIAENFQCGMPEGTIGESILDEIK